MRTKRFRCLIVFVAAMSIANNAVASVSASFASLGRLAAVAAMHVYPATERPAHAAPIDAHCITQCIQSYREPTHQIANNGLTIAPIPVSPGPGLWVVTETTRPRFARAPELAGPRLPILFGNLRN